MGLDRRIKKHRKSKSSPGIIHGKRVSTDSIDSIEESPINHDNDILIWPRVNENLKKNQDSESESESEVFDERSVDSKHLTESILSVNGEDKDDYPIYSPDKPSSFNYSLSSELPSSSSSSNSFPSSSDVSSPLPSSSSSTSSYDPKFKPKESNNGFEDLTIQVPDKRQDSYLAHLKAIMPPRIQVMDRSGGGFDPHRIPSAIFETSKSSTPVEWSVASNDSLFSINLGRSNSFTAERILAWGEMIKSGEAELRPSAIFRADTDNLSSICVEESYESNIELELKKNEEIGVDEKIGENRVADASNEVGLKAIDEDIKDKKRRYNSVASLKYQDSTPAASIQTKASDESGGSSSSFAFPVLGDGAKTIDNTYALEARSPQSPRPPQLTVAPRPVKEAKASHSCFNWSWCWPCSCSRSSFRSCSSSPCSNCSFRNFTCSSCSCSTHSCSWFRRCSSPPMCSWPSCHHCSCPSCFSCSCSSCHRRSCSSCFSCSCHCFRSR